MISKTYQVSNICCEHCTETIERELTPIDGVEKINTQTELKQVTVEVNGEDVLRKVEETLDEIGYPVASAGL